MCVGQIDPSNLADGAWLYQHFRDLRCVMPLSNANGIFVREFWRPLDVRATRYTRKNAIIGDIMRIVVDTNVLVAARRSSLGASHLLLEEWLGGALEVAVTVALFLEYEAVLKRPQHMTGMTSMVDELLDALASVSVAVESRFSWRPQLRDPDDDFVLDAAMNAGASAIVTFNQADFSPQAKNLGLSLLTPAQFLGSMK